uniref:uncharacterized protein LOC122591791 n=1 Tax=Erigeron canadensis TaxID=72917 RepID=UPI001CB9BA9B|nr:uncharacterized protein LOC122591791 [Erigeron canadensis]
MEAILDAQGLWETIEPEEKAVIDAKKSKTTRAFIFQAIPEEIILQVAKKKTAKEVWESLKTRYVGVERVQKARLRYKSEFEALRMREGETIYEYSGRLSAMISKYKLVGAILEDEELVRKLFDTVTDKFIPMMAGAKQFIKMEEIESQGGGKSNNKWGGNRACGSNSERGGKTGSRGRGSSRGRGFRGSSSSFNEFSKNYKARDKKNVKCYNCQGFGHYAAECKMEKKTEPEAHLTRDDDDDEPTLMLAVAGEWDDEFVTLEEPKVFLQQENEHEERRDLWYLDNGPSNHMTGRKDVFAELNENVTGKVRFGDGSRVEIKGKGTILFQCKNGDQLTIREVYYIPALTTNILSLGQLTEVGYDVCMHREFLKLYDIRNRLVMKVERSKNRLYKIKLSTTKPVCLSACLVEDEWLWHARLGLVNFQDLELM